MYLPDRLEFPKFWPVVSMVIKKFNKESELAHIKGCLYYGALWRAC